MFCISINYKTASADIRKHFAFSAEQRKALMQKLLADGISECVVLCTCNRTEIYFCGDTERCAEPVKRELAALSGFAVEAYIMQFHGQNAVSHLFRVASGIESMVIGEDEILRQTKKAYQEAQACAAVQYELNMTFQAAAACAKKIKTCTALSKTPVSSATLAANEAARLGGHVNVLIIGATGQIGSAVMKNLLSHANVSITATLRNHGERFREMSFRGVRTVDYAQRYSAAANADCIISATSGPHYTITASGLRESCMEKLPKLLIDLAVPSDIDEAISEMSGVRRIGIDYFSELAAENNALKASSAEEAGSIIGEYADELNKKLMLRDFMPYLEQFRQTAGSIPPERLLYHLRDTLHAEQFSAVLKALQQWQL